MTVTESDQIRPPEVSDRQSIAIDALVAGSTHLEAAEKAGVQQIGRASCRERV